MLALTDPSVKPEQAQSCLWSLQLPQGLGGGRLDVVTQAHIEFLKSEGTGLGTAPGQWLSFSSTALPQLTRLGVVGRLGTTTRAVPTTESSKQRSRPPTSRPIPSRRTANLSRWPGRTRISWAVPRLGDVRRLPPVLRGLSTEGTLSHALLAGRGNGLYDRRNSPGSLECLQGCGRGWERRVNHERWLHWQHRWLIVGCAANSDLQLRKWHR